MQRTSNDPWNRPNMIGELPDQFHLLDNEASLSRELSFSSSERTGQIVHALGERTDVRSEYLPREIDYRNIVTQHMPLSIKPIFKEFVVKSDDLQLFAAVALSQNLALYDENRTRSAITYLALTVLAGIGAAVAQLYVLPPVVVIGAAVLTLSLAALTIYKIWCSRKTTIVDIYKLILQAKFSEASEALVTYKKTHGKNAEKVAYEECPFFSETIQGKEIPLSDVFAECLGRAGREWLGAQSERVLKMVRAYSSDQAEKYSLLESLPHQCFVDSRKKYRIVKDPLFFMVKKICIWSDDLNDLEQDEWDFMPSNMRRDSEFEEDVAELGGFELERGVVRESGFELEQHSIALDPLKIKVIKRVMQGVTKERVGAKTYNWLKRVSKCKTHSQFAKMHATAPLTYKKLDKLIYA